jgi:hypothetical protein
MPRHTPVAIAIVPRAPAAPRRVPKAPRQAPAQRQAPTPRQSRWQRINDHLKNHYYPFINNTTHVELVCIGCKTHRRWSNQTINAFIRSGTVPPCKSDICSPVIPEGFSLVEIDHEDNVPVISCNACECQYYNHKKAKYFACYCQLSTKQKECDLYTQLCNANHKVYREAYFRKELSSHKCDLLVLLGDGRKIFLEVDGPEHAGSAQDLAFHELFKNNREDDEFLIRIQTSRTPAEVLAFVTTLETTEFEPISLLLGAPDGEPQFLEL